MPNPNSSIELGGGGSGGGGATPVMVLPNVDDQAGNAQFLLLTNGTFWIVQEDDVDAVLGTIVKTPITAADFDTFGQGGVDYPIVWGGVRVGDAPNPGTGNAAIWWDTSRQAGSRVRFRLENAAASGTSWQPGFLAATNIYWIGDPDEASVSVTRTGDVDTDTEAEVVALLDALANDSEFRTEIGMADSLVFYYDQPDAEVNKITSYTAGTLATTVKRYRQVAVGGLRFRDPIDQFTGTNLGACRTARDTYFNASGNEDDKAEFAAERQLAIVLNPTNSTDNVFETYIGAATDVSVNALWLDRTDALQGNPGDMGAQARFLVYAWINLSVAPTVAPVGGTFTRSTGVKTVPVGYTGVAVTPAAGEKTYITSAVVNPLTDDDVVNLVWAVPAESPEYLAAALAETAQARAEAAEALAEQAAAQAQDIPAGSPRGRLVATSPTLPVAIESNNSVIAFGANEIWTIEADAPDGFAAGPAANNERLYFPDIHPAGSNGVWEVVEVDGLEIAEVFIPQGGIAGASTADRRVQIPANITADQKLRTGYWPRSSSTPGYIQITGAGTTVPVNTVVKIYLSVVRGASGMGGDPVGVNETNLAVDNRAADSLDITSDTGTDATIPSASTTEAGLMSATDKVALDAVGDGETNLAVDNRDADSLDITSDTGTDATIPSASTTEAGLESAADKTKLDGIAANATALTLAQALAAILAGTNVTIDRSVQDRITISSTAMGGGSGTTFRYGPGAPADSLGGDGDSYLDTTAGIFYLRTTGAYVSQYTDQTGMAGGLTEAQVRNLIDTLSLRQESNFTDLADVVEGRSNLGVLSRSEVDARAVLRYTDAEKSKLMGLQPTIDLGMPSVSPQAGSVFEYDAPDGYVAGGWPATGAIIQFQIGAVSEPDDTDIEIRVGTDDYDLTTFGGRFVKLHELIDDTQYLALGKGQALTLVGPADAAGQIVDITDSSLPAPDADAIGRLFLDRRTPAAFIIHETVASSTPVGGNFSLYANNSFYLGYGAADSDFPLTQSGDGSKFYWNTTDNQFREWRNVRVSRNPDIYEFIYQTVHNPGFFLGGTDGEYLGYAGGIAGLRLRLPQDGIESSHRYIGVTTNATGAHVPQIRELDNSSYTAAVNPAPIYDFVTVGLYGQGGSGGLTAAQVQALIDAAVAALRDGAPSDRNTLNELNNAILAVLGMLGTSAVLDAGTSVGNVVVVGPEGVIIDGLIHSDIARDSEVADSFIGGSISNGVITLTRRSGVNAVTLSVGGGGGSDDGVITGATLDSSTNILTITRSVGADLTVDLSPLQGLNQSEVDARIELLALRQSENLSDLDDVGEARTALAVYSQTEVNDYVSEAFTSVSYIGPSRTLVFQQLDGTTDSVALPSEGDFIGLGGDTFIVSETFHFGDYAIVDNTLYIYYGRNAATFTQTSITGAANFARIPVMGAGNLILRTQMASGTPTVGYVPTATATGVHWAAQAGGGGGGTPLTNTQVEDETDTSTAGTITPSVLSHAVDVHESAFVRDAASVTNTLTSSSYSVTTLAVDRLQAIHF